MSGPLLPTIDCAGRAVLALNCPQAMNALSRGPMAALADAIEARRAAVRERGRRG